MWWECGLSLLLVAGAPQAGKREQQEAFEALAAQAREREPEKRRSAVRALAEFGGKEAWELVLEALADPESKVGDAAQEALGKLVDPRIALELFGAQGLGSKDERVALRVAEALAHVQVPLDGEKLARELASRDRERVRALLSSIERLARAQRITGRVERVVDSVERLERSGSDPWVSATALCALAEVAPELAYRRATDALRDSSALRRCAAGYVLARLKSPDALSGCLLLARDREPMVRLRGVECLDVLGTRASMLAIVSRMADEPRLRLRWRAVDLLQRTSGLKHRLDPRPWQLWADGLPEGGVVRRGALAAGEARAEPVQATRASGFAGLQLVSDRVTFLFDFSGSMWMPMADGRIPKDVVTEKLKLALEALPETTAFNLIPYTNVPIPWSTELRPARRKDIAEALEWFSRCREKGRGNFYDAARLAWLDPDVDTIVVLTDGVPTGGLHSDMDLIVPRLVELARIRPVIVDSILVDTPPGTVRRWRELSERTGGRLIEVDLARP